MTSRDARGLELSNASAASAAAYDESLALLNAYALDPLATIDAALAEQPDFVSGSTPEGRPADRRDGAHADAHGPRVHRSGRAPRERCQ